MSRSLTVDKNGQYSITIDSMYECKRMYNGVCFNDQSEHWSDLVCRKICAYCDLFEEEDGLIKKPDIIKQD